MKRQPPDDLHAFVDHVVTELQALDLDATPLQRVQQTALTTSSELLGELGKAVRQVQKQTIASDAIKTDLSAIMQAVHKVWPRI